jgi:PAS domain S-box-containing protein
MLLAILILSTAVQFCAAGMALLLLRRSRRTGAWALLAAGFLLMGVRRAISLTDALSSDAGPLDPAAECVALLISFLMLAGVWMARRVFDDLTRLRLDAEGEVEKRKRAEADLGVSLRAAEDATARLRESEEKLRFLSDNLPGVLLYQIDCGEDGRDRRFTYVSRGVEELHELTVDEVMRSPYAIYTQLRAEDTASYAQLEKEAIKNQTLFRAEARIALPSGKTKWILIESAPRRASNNHLVWDGFEIDISDRKRLEEDLRRHGETLEKAVADRTARLRSLASELALAEQRERRRLSDFLHDDLQQVLAAAKLGAERLAANMPDESTMADARRLLDLVTEAVGRVSDFNRGLTPPLLHVVGLGPALRELAEQMPKRHGLRVIADIGDLPDIGDEAARSQLFHAVSEVLFNAAKHSGADTAQLRARYDGGRVEVAVTDAGKGFDAEAVMGGKANGGGYGLFNIRERIGDVGGELRVVSTPGQGTSVTITLPVAAHPHPAAHAATRKAPSDAARAVRKGRRARVVVADDHDLVRTGLSKLLALDPRLDVVGQAKDGAEAVALARELRTDVVVMDIRMPVMDGIEATRLILSESPDVIVVGVSAFSDEGFRSAMLAAGAVDLLAKADAGQRLAAKIVECMDRRDRDSDVSVPRGK